MKLVCCNYCGSDDTDLVNSGPDLLLNRGGDYRLVRCRPCGLIYQNPQLTLDDLSEHYPEEYRPHQKDNGSGISFLRSLDIQHGLNRYCRQITKQCPHPGKLLDVGCGTGLFLNQMQKRHWEVAGVELSPHAAEHARRTFHLNVFTGTLEQAAFPSNSFDVVTLMNVFEHVIDPKQTLMETSRVLKPDGLLVLCLPNPGSIEARLFGPCWVGWDRPRHLHLFTPGVIEKYLQLCGFKPNKIESLGGRLGLTLISLEMMLNARHVSSNTYQPLLKLLYNWPIRLATWPVYRMGECLNKTSLMTVSARSAKQQGCDHAPR